MKNMFIVKIQWIMPYPVEKEYRIKASTLASAASRGLREWRKENKGKKIKSVRLQIIKI